MMTVVMVLILFPVMEFISFASFFAVWGTFELFQRCRFRKEIPCPYCGFDASWYKRDVKIARKIVGEFWAKREQTADAGVETSG